MDNQNRKEDVLALPPALPGVRDLLKRAWQAYRKRFWVFVGLTVAPLFIVLPLILIFAGIFMFLPKSTMVFLPIVVVPIFIIVSLAVNLWFSVALLYAISEREQGTGIKIALQKAWCKILSYWWVSLLSAFLIIGGLFLFFIPGFIFSVWFSFATFVLVAENLKGMDALFRSKQLVSGYWGKVFWRFFVAGVITFFIWFFVAALASALVGKNAGSIVNWIFWFLLGPLYMIYLFLIYEDLKKIKAGVVFEPPTKGTKTKYILMAIAGFALPLIIIFGLLLYIIVNAPFPYAPTVY